MQDGTLVSVTGYKTHCHIHRPARNTRLSVADPDTLVNASVNALYNASVIARNDATNNVVTYSIVWRCWSSRRRTASAHRERPGQPDYNSNRPEGLYIYAPQPRPEHGVPTDCFGDPSHCQVAGLLSCKSLLHLWLKSSPFGVPYSSQAGSLQDLATQPYDKITPVMQARYLETSPHNLVRIILGERFPGDTTARMCTLALPGI